MIITAEAVGRCKNPKLVYQNTATSVRLVPRLKIKIVLYLQRIFFRVLIVYEDKPRYMLRFASTNNPTAEKRFNHSSMIYPNY